MELAFFCLYKEGVLEKPLKDCLDVVDMVLLGARVDEDIIQVDESMFAEHVTEYIIDQDLENCRGSLLEQKGQGQLVRPKGMTKYS